MKIIMIKKLLVLIVLGVVFDISGLFAQAGNEPRLATTGTNKPAPQVSSQTNGPKPVLSATSNNGNKRKQPGRTVTKVTPRVAATGSNSNITEVKKK
jgi:hypothetical protein